MPNKPKKPAVDEVLDWLNKEEDFDPAQDTWPMEADLGEPEATWDGGLAIPEEALPPMDTLDDLTESLNPLQQVGYRETVSLPDQGVHQLQARFSTDSEGSTLHGSIRQVVANQLTLELGKTVVELPTLEDQDTLLVSIAIAVGDLRFEGPVQVVATEGAPYLVIGRDLMSGQVLVDPSAAWVQSKR
jgi:hypothetical protein